MGIIHSDEYIAQWDDLNSVSPNMALITGRIDRFNAVIDDPFTLECDSCEEREEGLTRIPVGWVNGRFRKPGNIFVLSPTLCPDCARQMTAMLNAVRAEADGDIVITGV
jgi:hypothetical protein